MLTPPFLCIFCLYSFAFSFVQDATDPVWDDSSYFSSTNVHKCYEIEDNFHLRTSIFIMFFIEDWNSSSCIGKSRDNWWRRIEEINSDIKSVENRLQKQNWRRFLYEIIGRATTQYHKMFLLFCSQYQYWMKKVSI